MREIRKLLEDENIKYLKNPNGEVDKKWTEPVTLEKLFYLLKKLKYVELSGECDVVNDAYYIHPDSSGWDEKTERPFSLLNNNAAVSWHSHPFGTKNADNSFPSIEDLQNTRLNYQTIYMIITEMGVYIMTATKQYISESQVKHFYRRMQRDELEEVTDKITGLTISPSRSRGNERTRDEELNLDICEKNFLNNKFEKYMRDAHLYIKLFRLDNKGEIKRRRRDDLHVYILDCVVKLYSDKIPSLRAANSNLTREIARRELLKIVNDNASERFSSTSSLKSSVHSPGQIKRKK
jgi:hypothetical protein